VALSPYPGKSRQQRIVSVEPHDRCCRPQPFGDEGSPFGRLRFGRHTDAACRRSVLERTGRCSVRQDIRENLEVVHIAMFAKLCDDRKG
jgi:hypothetical protein